VSVQEETRGDGSTGCPSYNTSIPTSSLSTFPRLITSKTIDIPSLHPTLLHLHPRNRDLPFPCILRGHHPPLSRRKTIRPRPTIHLGRFDSPFRHRCSRTETLGGRHAIPEIHHSMGKGRETPPKGYKWRTTLHDPSTTFLARGNRVGEIRGTVQRSSSV